MIFVAYHDCLILMGGFENPQYDVKVHIHSERSLSQEGNLFDCFLSLVE